LKPTLELSMIVKDGGPALARCLSSAAPFVDRIVIGDTGSTDDSAAVAREFGAEVFVIPWEQDFSRARNRLLAQRKCDWILVLDADEMLDASAGARMHALLQSPSIFAWHNPRWNYMREMSTRLGFQTARPNPVLIEESRAYPGYVPLPTTRLFRSHPGIYYEGCVHETITRRLDALHLPTAAADFVVHHFGHVEDPEDVRKQKDQLYQVLGEKKLVSNPDDPQALIELGLAELEHARRPAAALSHFERACQVSPQSAVAWLYAGACLVRLNRLPEAIARLERTAALGLRNALFYQTLGDAHFHARRYAEARSSYQQVANMGEASPLSEAKLGACDVHLGSANEGVARMQKAVADAPAFGELYDILAAGALLAGRVELAAKTAQARLKIGAPTDFHFQLATLLQNQLRAQNPNLALQTHA
jgi:Flp pilus assembly protein TadD